MGNLWSASVARRSLVGHERTSNPVPAAVALLGTAAKLAGRLGKSKDPERLAENARLARAGNVAELQARAGNLATRVGREDAARLVAELKAGAPVTAGKAPSTAARVRAAVARAPRAAAAPRARAAPRVKAARLYVRYNPDTGERGLYPAGSAQYASWPNRKPPAGGRAVGGLAGRVVGSVGTRLGGTAAAGLVGLGAKAIPYYGAVPLAGVAAAGVAAYYITTQVQRYFAARTVKKEEAGVQTALAFREARAQFAAEQGRPPNAAELAEMKAAYQAALVDLGYNPVTFTRQRGAVARFLSGLE